MLDLLGIIAGTCTTIAFLPQLIRVIRTKSAKDISLGMFILFCIGVLLWLIYGIILSALPIIIANTITLILAGLILFFKIRFG